MKIRVTSKHIKAGKRGSDTSCPIALAVKETVQKSCLPKFLRSMQINVGGDVEIGHLCMEGTNKMHQFIIDFDEGKKVKPFTFSLKF